MTEEKYKQFISAKYGSSNYLDLFPQEYLDGHKSIILWGEAHGISKTHINDFLRNLVKYNILPQHICDALISARKRLSDSIRKSTNLAKYGAPSPLGNADIKAKVASTCVSRYGVHNPTLNPDIRAKAISGTKRRLHEIHKHNLESFGRANKDALTLEELVSRLSAQHLELVTTPDLLISLSDQKFQVRCTLCGREFSARRHTGHRQGCSEFTCCECQNHGTKLQDFVRDYIRSLGYTCMQWSHIAWMKNQEIDCYVEELSIGFEVNGYLTHNSESNPYKRDPKGETFHQFKSQACLDHGISLYHIWHHANSDSEQFVAKSIVDRAIGIATSGHLSGVDPGDKLNRDTLPDPSVVGLPYTELPPEPFDSPNGICYNSGYWQF